jgi:DNA-binding response OmpR family regulator
MINLLHLSDVGRIPLDYFPRVNESDLRPIYSEATMSAALTGKKILLVDDDNDILISMQAAFEPTGAMIETASNGNKAVEIAERTQPDVVILDMMLPGRSGFMVLERIKSKKPRNAKPFVIMITGNPGARHKMYAESQGVSEYFNKPVKLDKLIAAVEKLMAPPAAPAATA